MLVNVVNPYFLLLLSVITIVFALLFLSSRKPRGIPPGPQLTLPVIGDILVFKDGDILRTFQKLRKQYGDIFSLYLGRELTVVVNGYDLLQKAAVKRGMQFVGRPQRHISNVCREGKGLVFATGEIWKNQRQFISKYLKTIGPGVARGNVCEAIIQKEVCSLTEYLKEQEGRSFNIGESIKASTANVILSVLIGKHHSQDDAVLRKLLHDVDDSDTVLPKLNLLTSCIPFLKDLPGDPLKFDTFLKLFRDFYSYFENIYKERLNTARETKDQDFLNIYMKEMKIRENESDSEFTIFQLKVMILDLFLAGSKSSATAICWAILVLLNYPDIQTRLQLDIDKALPGNRAPCFEDKEKLPYVDAFINEVLRFSNVTPLAIPHAAFDNKDMEFEGFRIPQNCSIIFNLDSVLSDPDVFKDPKSFYPGRFLDDTGKAIKPKELIPFGLGLRNCLGEHFANAELFIFLTSLIREFDFLLPEGNEIPKLSGSVGALQTPKPFQVRIKRRR